MQMYGLFLRKQSYNGFNLKSSPVSFKEKRRDIKWDVTAL